MHNADDMAFTYLARFVGDGDSRGHSSNLELKAEL